MGIKARVGRDWDIDTEEWRPLWRYGRLVIDLEPDTENDTGLRLEWSLFGHRFYGLGFEADSSEHSWQLGIHLGPVNLWATIHDRRLPMPRPCDRDRYPQRALKFSIHGGSIFWEVWKDPHCWSSDDGWRNSSWNFIDAIFGKVQPEEVVIDEDPDALIPMPEANYPAKVTVIEYRRTRPRDVLGVLADRTRIARVVMDGNIPVPSKYGGDDGLNHIQGPARSITEAVGMTVERALRSRAKRKNWLPPAVRTS